MANIKITDLNAYADPQSTDVLPIVDVANDATKKVSIADLMENAGAGTEALPGIAFDGDPNTGIYRPDADQIAISTAGAQRLAISATGAVTIPGNLTVQGTTTFIDSQTLQVEDKNIEMGVVTTPTDTTADGGGITLKGATDKTINWVNSTDSWTSSENVDLASGKTYKVNGTDVLSGTTLGSGVTGSSLTSVGTLTNLTVSGDVSMTGTGAIDVAAGTTAQRPTPSNGMLRYNTDDNAFEGYANGAWGSIGGGATPAGVSGSIQINDGAGALGAVTDFKWDSANTELDVPGDISLDDGGTYTTTLQSVTATADRFISFPDQTGVVSLVSGINGAVQFNNAGVSGASALTVDATKKSFGYGSDGGSITQATNKATAVTLNKPTGQITMNAAALAADTTVTFTLTNSSIAAGDILILNHLSAGTAGAYMLNSQSAAGSASINVRNVTAGSLSEAIVIGFAVIKSTTV